MFEGLGGLTYSRRWVVLGAAVAFVVFAVVWGTGVFGSLTGGGFEDTKSESYRGQQLLDERFGRSDADVIAIYTSKDRSVDDPAVREAVTQTLAALPRDKVASVTSYYSTKSPQFVSTDKHSTYAVFKLQGDDDDERETNLAAVRDKFDAPGVQTQLGGPAAVGLDIGDQEA